MPSKLYIHLKSRRCIVPSPPPRKVSTSHSKEISAYGADILKAARIKFSFEHHDQRGTGAYELDGTMIDMPVYKQVSE